MCTRGEVPLDERLWRLERFLTDECRLGFWMGMVSPNQTTPKHSPPYKDEKRGDNDGLRYDVTDVAFLWKRYLWIDEEEHWDQKVSVHEKREGAKREVNRGDDDAVIGVEHDSRKDRDQ